MDSSWSRHDSRVKTYSKAITVRRLRYFSFFIYISLLTCILFNIYIYIYSFYSFYLIFCYIYIYIFLLSFKNIYLTFDRFERRRYWFISRKKLKIKKKKEEGNIYKKISAYSFKVDPRFQRHIKRRGNITTRIILAAPSRAAHPRAINNFLQFSGFGENCFRLFVCLFVCLDRYKFKGIRWHSFEMHLLLLFRRDSLFVRSKSITFLSLKNVEGGKKN